jgi:predicted alpha/beta hydrolase
MQMHDISAMVRPDPRRVSIQALGAELAGRLYLPAARPRVAVVLHGATGVPQSFYAPFATWLAAEMGYACLSYDYRDFGASARGGMRRSKATMTDWGIHDQSAALAALAVRLPEADLWVIGHSLGGAMLPYQKGLDRVARAIVIGAGMVHVSDHPWPYQALARLFWQGHGPVLTRLAGFLPGRLTGFGSDLPKGVYWQWRRWCLTRGYHLTDAGGSLPMPNLAGVSAPIKFVAVEDDPMVPARAVWRLMQFFPESVKRQLVLRPAEHGLNRIGHLGPFTRRSAVLWPQIIA